MLKSSKSFLALDFGAGSLKVAEFEATEAGGLVLRRYGYRPLGLEGAQDAARENVLKKAFQELSAEQQFASRRSNICAPGFHVFSKFVKLPPVDSSKVTQIIQYEAQQNVPFPLEEVVWDYQILGTTAANELEVLLVAIKSDVVEGLFRLGEATGLKIDIVDVSPASLCNSFRYNYPDVEGCTMLLDIGAKTSNLLLFEKDKVYARGINIGANSITQDFAAESRMRFNEAEKIKIAEGFVSLGGAYEEPENPHQAAISKIARQVMTRLHIQVNQTIQFYRGQQGGSAPQRLFLAGGASVMPYTAQFFAEKLNIPVDYFNPFRNIQIDPAVNLEELAKVAHAYGEVVGLGLRNAAQCPVELNLVPKSIRQRQEFDQKKPYLIATIFSLVLVVFAFGLFYDRLAQVKAATLEDINTHLMPLQDKESRLAMVEDEIRQKKEKMEALTGYLDQRVFWSEMLNELSRVLRETEQKLSQPGLDVGIWVEKLGTNIASGPIQLTNESETADDSSSVYRMDPVLAARYGLIPSAPAAPEEDPMADPTAATTEPTDGISVIEARLTAVNLNRGGDRTRNAQVTYEVEQNLKASPIFDPDGTKLSGDLQDVDDQAMTFSFGVRLKLKKPIQK